MAGFSNFQNVTVGDATKLQTGRIDWGDTIEDSLQRLFVRNHVNQKYHALNSQCDRMTQMTNLCDLCRLGNNSETFYQRRKNADLTHAALFSQSWERCAFCFRVCAIVSLKKTQRWTDTLP
jgi:hypothetical protein